MAAHQRTVSGQSLTSSNEVSSQQTQALSHAGTTMYQSHAVHLDQPVTSLSISPNGREVVLAAKRGLYIVDLENPYDPPRVIHHMTNWEVTDVQWNPHKSRHHWIATTSNQKTLVWNLAPTGSDSSSKHIQYILGGHQRAVSDLNWSPFHPDILATCSYDSYIHLWDLRKPPDKPSTSFCAWTAGATQVKFNRLNEYLLASSHDTDVKIWDMRRGSTPMTLITAHMTKIYGIDWSRNHEDMIITCSQDRQVKFWDITRPQTHQAKIVTGSPVWRARFTPFGNGVVTMPQRKDTNLLLWSCDDLENPVYSFEGHTDVPREFVWRVRGDKSDLGDDRAFQLITWSKDQHLRLWPIDPEVLKAVGHDNGTQVSHDLPDISDSYVFEPVASFGVSLPVDQNPRATSSPVVLPTQPSRAAPPPHVQHKPFEMKEYSHGSSLPIAQASPPLLEQSTAEWLESQVTYDENLDVTCISEPKSLEEEIVMVTKRYPSVRFEKLNVEHRTCTITLQRGSDVGTGRPSMLANVPSAFLRVDITFPRAYPDRASPVFAIQKTGTLSMANRALLSTTLNQIADSATKTGSFCLEACIKYLLYGDMDGGPARPLIGDISPMVSPLNRNASGILPTGLSPQDEDGAIPQLPDIGTSITFLGDADDSDIDDLHDGVSFSNLTGRLRAVPDTGVIADASREKNVPFPRLSGATFSPSGKLVYFFSPLPHPSTTQYVARSFVVRKQQPVVHTEHFTTHPESYAHYENYRAFILSKYPKMFFTGSVLPDVARFERARPQPAISGDTDSEIPDPRISDYFMDSDDTEDDNVEHMSNIFWRPQPDVPMHASADFLAKLQRFRNPVPNINASASTVQGFPTHQPKTSSSPPKAIPPLAMSLANHISSPLAKSPMSPLTPSSASLDRDRDLPSPIAPASARHRYHQSLSKAVDFLRRPLDHIPLPERSNIVTTPSTSERELVHLSAAPFTDPSPRSSFAARLLRGDNGSPPNAMRIPVARPASPQLIRKHRRSASADASVSGSELGSEVGSSFDERVGRRGTVDSGRPSFGSTIEGTLPFGSEGEFDKENPVDKLFMDPDSPVAQNAAQGNQGHSTADYGSVIYLRDLRDLLPVSEALAAEYSLQGDDPVEVCVRNCQAAYRRGRLDLAKIWTLAGILVGKCWAAKDDKETGPFVRPRRARRRVGKMKDQTQIDRDGNLFLQKIPEAKTHGKWHNVQWANHPFGHRLVRNLFEYLERIGDVQTLGLLSCVFKVPWPWHSGPSRESHDASRGIQEAEALLIQMGIQPQYAWPEASKGERRPGALRPTGQDSGSLDRDSHRSTRRDTFVGGIQSNESRGTAGLTGAAYSDQSSSQTDRLGSGTSYAQVVMGLTNPATKRGSLMLPGANVPAAEAGVTMWVVKPAAAATPEDLLQVDKQQMGQKHVFTAKSQEAHRMWYASMLGQWNLAEKRGEVLKFVAENGIGQFMGVDRKRHSGLGTSAA
ncbi:hypothetical protein HDU85_001799 [Gaertneriomyces sp. JEL0708]|nr:hypothetical protein HDU85_001799 [Gaertneriomyces sp. JEL0708]